MAIFRYQAGFNEVYKNFLEILDVNPLKVNSINEIPFLPVEIFKYKKVTSIDEEPRLYFKSSGTSNMERSTHFVFDSRIYERSIIESFKLFYGNPDKYIFLALLPNYIEQENSSLVYMADKLMEYSGQNQTGFYLHNFDELFNSIKINLNSDRKIFLIGVSYALLDFATQFPLKLNNSIVMETGGMKGRKTEMVREELHQQLTNAFKVEIHSEYGMTELMSQAYSKKNGIFKTPPWLRILIRDIQDPKLLLENKFSGGINIIDLANIDSCSFIATQDIGIKYSDESFEVIGRIDNSDIRGCSLLFN